MIPQNKLALCSGIGYEHWSYLLIPLFPMKAPRFSLVVAGIALAAVCDQTRSAHADETWVGVSLHPAGASSSEAKTVSTAGQFGFAVFGGESKAAGWNGTASSFVDLAPPGSTDSAALGASGNLQGGYGTFSGSQLAGIWAGTSGSFGLLHPTGTGSRINAVSGSQQAGAVFVGSFPLIFIHAAVWNGSVLNYVDLHPVAASSSEVLGTNGSRQVGYALASFQRAVLWSGTNASAIDLHPSGATGSIAYGIDATKQVGEAVFGGNNHAGVWFGNGVFTDLHPTGYLSSSMRSTDGNRQAGLVNNGLATAAGVWAGTAASFVNLHSFLPAGYGSSEAYGILKVGTTTYVCGKANHSSLMRDEAVLWTLAGPTGKVLGKPRFKTKRPTLRLRGTSTNASSVKVTVGKTPAKEATGTNTWSRTVRLKDGRNKIVVEAVNSFGDKSKAVLLSITLD